MQRNLDDRRRYAGQSTSHGGYEDRRGANGGYEDRRGDGGSVRDRGGGGGRHGGGHNNSGGFEVRRDRNAGYEDRNASHKVSHISSDVNKYFIEINFAFGKIRILSRFLPTILLKLTL